MTTRFVTTTWRGLTVSAEVYSEPDPLSSAGKMMYDVNSIDFPEMDDLLVQGLLIEAFDDEIREAILEAVK